MQVRALQPEDRAEWLRMRCALWPDSTPEEHAADLDAALARGAIFVSPRNGGGLAGFVEVGTRPYAEGCATSPVGFVEGWYVDADQRRRGIGRALVVAAEDWARSLGCSEMASDTWLDNQLSQEAHQRLGYQEVERLVCFRKDLL